VGGELVGRAVLCCAVLLNEDEEDRGVARHARRLLGPKKGSLGNTWDLGEGGNGSHNIRELMK